MSSAMGKGPRGESQIKCGDTKPFDLSNHCWFSSSRWKFSSKKSLIKSALKCITKVYNRSSSGYSTGSKKVFIAVYKRSSVGISVIVLNRLLL
jgi:hypothetical protein